MSQVEGFTSTSQQIRLWRQAGAGACLNTACVLELTGPLDHDRLQHTLITLCGVHASLHTALIQPTGLKTPLQVLQESHLKLVDVTTDLDPLTWMLQAASEPVTGMTAKLLEKDEHHHLLLLILPAVLSDEPSLATLIRDLCTIYGGGEIDEEATTQYLHYSEWLSGLIEEGGHEDGVDFWEQQLKSIPATAPPALLGMGAFSWSRQAVDTHEVADQVQDLCQHYGWEPALFWAACWNLVCLQMTGADSASFGHMTTRRAFEELTEAVGPFSKVLPAICKPGEDATFPNWVEQLAPQLEANQDWQDFFPADAANFWTGFVFTATPAANTHHSGDLTVTPLHSAGRNAAFWYQLVLDGDHGLLLDYDGGLINDTAAALTAERLITFATSICRNPDQPLCQHTLVGPKERDILFHQLQVADDAPKIVDRPIPQMFAAAAAANPEGIALIHGSETMTFAQLEHRSAQLAGFLAARGVGPDKLVALCFERSLDMVVALLGVWRAGGGYLPLDPHLPPGRLAMMIEDAGVLLTLTTADLSERVTCTTAHVALDSEPDIQSAHPLRNLTIDPNATAYVIYTSGSTGKPKGVVLEHANLCAYLNGLLSVIPLAECRHFAMISTFAADLGNTMLFPPLCLGRALHIVPADMIGDGAALAQWFRRHGADSLKITPSHLAALMVGDHAADVLPERVLVLGGEAASSDWVARLQTLRPDLKIFNHYGPTEATVGAVVHAYEGDGFPLGKPLPGNRVYLLDQTGQPVTLGAAGELYISGPTVARGYLNRETLTAERFLDDPYADDRRMYRTGDLAIYNDDGLLVFKGRMDHQLKIHGYRVETGEVEAVIRDSGLVSDVVITPRQSDKDTFLVAWLVRSEGYQKERLTEHLNRHLPAYMHPTITMVLPRIPLTPNGKVDRKALAELPLDNDTTDLDRTPPRDDLERVLTLVWEEVLGETPLGVHAPFFGQGGHSLLLITMNTRLHDLFGVQMGIDKLFESATIAAGADLLRQEAGDQVGDKAAVLLELIKLDEDAKRQNLIQAGLPVPDTKIREALKKTLITDLDTALLHHRFGTDAQDDRITPATDDAPAPLSYEQQRLWFLYCMDETATTFNNPASFRLHGELDADALGRCFAAIEARHQTLRTTFALDGGRTIQQIQPARDQVMAIEDLSHLNPTDQQTEIDTRLHKELTVPFDLRTGPVWRTTLLRLNPTEHVLIFTIHHICSDGWSMRLMIRELNELYRHHHHGEPLNLPRLAVQYADYAHWQMRRFAGERLKQEQDFWRNYLASAALSPFIPTDKPRGAVQTTNGAMSPIAIEEALAKRLRELSGKHNVGLFTTLLTGWFLVLRYFSKQDDLVTGTDLANRNRGEIESLIGFFVNQMALRLHIEGNPTLSDIFHQTADSARRALSHQEIPFPEVVKALDVDRDMGYSPIFQTKMFLEHKQPAPGAVDSLKMARLDTQTASARIDLTLGLWHEEGKGITGWLNYNVDLFHAATIEGKIRVLHLVLANLVDKPDTTLNDLIQTLDTAEQAHRSEDARARRGKVARKSRRRKPVAVSTAALVTKTPLRPDGLLPLQIAPAGTTQVDLETWLGANRDAVASDLAKHGALLFRGFGVDNPLRFERIAQQLIQDIFRENSEHRPISDSGAVQIPVEYAADQQLLWHNENTFNQEWPAKIIFACAQPAQTGGETPLVDAREIYRRLPEDLRTAFAEKGVMYMRTYTGQMGLSWQKVFRTENREEAERRCVESGFQYEWLGDDMLQTRAVRPAVLPHPVTGQPCWLNQAQHWHFSCLDAKTRAAVAAVFEPKHYPRNCFLGDGSPIADEHMALILDQYRQLEVAFPWQKGDMVLIDNAAVAHGRNPYTGKRTILVSMGDMIRFQNT